MRFLVVSDIHGRYERLSRLLDMHKGIDALIFLGDGLSDIERADAYNRGFSVISVKGNCDGFSFLGRQNAPEESVVSFEGYKIFLLHGHTRGVKHSLANAIYAAEERGADIMLFGHTHEPIEKYLPEGEDYSLSKPLRIFNPGSLGASGDGWGYYGLIDIRDNGVLMSHGKI
jgi:putative phosphoesterase